MAACRARFTLACPMKPKVSLLEPSRRKSANRPLPERPKPPPCRNQRADRRTEHRAPITSPHWLLLALYPRGDFQTQRIEPDKAGSVVLVVGPGGIGFHGGDGWVVEADGRLAAGDHDV